MNFNHDLDFLERKDNGTLLIQKKEKLRESYLSEVELTQSKDGYIHFGDIVMLMNQGTYKASVYLNWLLFLGPAAGQERVLAIYAEDKINGGLSASDSLAPCSRNTFTIRPVDEGITDGENLKYGQKFKLESIASPNHFLNSEHTRYFLVFRQKKYHFIQISRGRPKLHSSDSVPLLIRVLKKSLGNRILRSTHETRVRRRTCSTWNFSHHQTRIDWPGNIRQCRAAVIKYHIVSLRRR